MIDRCTGAVPPASVGGDRGDSSEGDGGQDGTGGRGGDGSGGDGTGGDGSSFFGPGGLFGPGGGAGGPGGDWRFSQCSDRIDNDGDGKIDRADSGCLNPLYDPADDSEFNLKIKEVIPDFFNLNWFKFNFVNFFGARPLA